MKPKTICECTRAWGDVTSGFTEMNHTSKSTSKDFDFEMKHVEEITLESIEELNECLRIKPESFPFRKAYEEKDHKEYNRLFEKYFDIAYMKIMECDFDWKQGSREWEAAYRDQPKTHTV